MPRVYSEVYGCPSNIADQEFSLGMLKEAGFEIVSSEKDSDVNIIFTCIVKSPTEQRMIRRIQDITASGKPLVVAGCMTKTSMETIERMSSSASLIGPDSIDHIVETVGAALEGKRAVFIEDERQDKPGRPRVMKDSSVGIVPISIGCLSSCSYCAVKLARGRLKSYDPERIAYDVGSLVGKGCKEIWLTSQDNGCYGFDIGTNLAELLRVVCEVDGEFRIRVGMMNPSYLKGGFLESLVGAFDDEKVMKFIHIPVQSGSDRILKLMKRDYKVDDFERIVRNFRERFPDIFLSTDIIVGFPTETEEEFQMTIALVKRIKSGKVNLSKFGARPGTAALGMQQLPTYDISDRSKRLGEIITSS